MSIWQMCGAEEEGAKRDDYWSKRDNHGGDKEMEIYTRETHVGLVLALGEYNGYDDSDFYAVVWNPEKQEPERIIYASTRGWTYPNTAKVDATPEVLVAYEQFQERKRQEYAAAKAACEAATPTIGKRVVVTTSRKIAKGTEAEVFWFGLDKFARRYEGPGSAMLAEINPKGRKEGYRVGLKLADGSKVFVGATCVEVIGCAG